MERNEFIPIIAFLKGATGKELPLNSMEIYFELLGDLPVEVIQTAAKRVALEHRWATFPTVAELRAAAAETMRGNVTALSSAEAWRLAWKAACYTDPEVEGSLQRACKDLPPLVMEAMRIFGIPSLCYASPDFARPQFMKIYETLEDREKRQALLPDAVKKSIENQGVTEKHRVIQAGELTIGIGKEPGTI